MTGSTERLDRWSVVRTRHRPLAARNALRLTAVLMGAHGAILAAAPGLALSLFGAPPAPDAAMWIRSSGVVCAALAVVCWWAARWPASMMQRPVLLAAGIVTAVPAMIGGLTVLDGTVDPTFLIVLAIEAVLAVWIWWLLLTDRV